MKTSAVVFLLLASARALIGAPYQIAVIPKGGSNEYWKYILAGAVKAKADLSKEGIDVHVVWAPPAVEEDRDQQIELVKQFTEKKFDGIVLAPIDPKRLVAAAHAAIAANVPVTIFDSGLSSSTINSFVSTDNYKAGAQAARLLAKLLGGHGKVAVLRFQKGCASTEPREEGFIQTMKNYPDIEVIATDAYAGLTKDSAKEAALQLLEKIGTSVNGMFAPNEPSAIGLVNAVRSAGLGNGKIKVIGFDTSPALVSAVESGDAAGFIVQDPTNMGYLAVRAAVDRARGKPVESFIDTGATVVTASNLKEPAVVKLLSPPPGNLVLE